VAVTLKPDWLEYCLSMEFKGGPAETPSGFYIETL
jgi:hypothetical protein